MLSIYLYQCILTKVKISSFQFHQSWRAEQRTTTFDRFWKSKQQPPLLSHFWDFYISMRLNMKHSLPLESKKVPGKKGLSKLVSDHFANSEDFAPKNSKIVHVNLILLLNWFLNGSHTYLRAWHDTKKWTKNENINYIDTFSLVNTKTGFVNNYVPL